MLTLDRATYTLGARTLFREASLQIGKQEKLALVAPNGAGKSTLFKIITGQLAPNQGRISFTRGTTIGYLSQDLATDTLSQSIRTVVMQGNASLYAMEEEINLLLDKVAITPDQATLERLGELQETFATQGGYELASQAETLLGGIGFGTADFEKPLATFSGGWRMRVLLARLLLQAPDLLLLDEPTNHLDIVSIQWLENYLCHYPKAFVLISHDRHFLDKATTTTVEIAHAQLHRYQGNYSFYEQEKAGRLVLQEKAYTNQQKQISAQERFVARFRATSSKASQVQSVIKALDKLPRVPPIDKDKASMHLSFAHVPHAGKCISQGQDVDKAYGKQILLIDASWELMRGSKTALIGANGKGKSTLLKLIAKQIQPDAGSITLGHQVKAAYYAQHQLETMDTTLSVLETMEQAAAGQSITQLRTLLGAFLFPKEEVKKRVSVLSGGERARLALAKMMLAQANFLLLDEPTNHLDMPSVAALLQALKQYTGTLLFVSHDRSFIAGLASNLWYLYDGQVHAYPGDYKSYLFWKKEQQHTPRYPHLP